jgi:hypothetical protein
MRKPIFLLVAALSAAMFGSACGDDPKRPAPGIEGRYQPGNAAAGGGGSTDGGVADASDGGDAGACTNLSNTGTVVDLNAVNDDLPPGTGGTVLDGTYDIVEARLYQGLAGVPGLTGTTYQGSIRITGPTFERVVIVRTAAGPSETRSTGTFAASGTSATIGLTCPVAAQEQLAYSVLNNSLTLSNHATKESFVFARQP